MQYFYFCYSLICRKTKRQQLPHYLSIAFSGSKQICKDLRFFPHSSVLSNVVTTISRRVLCFIVILTFNITDHALLQFLFIIIHLVIHHKHLLRDEGMSHKKNNIK